MTTKRVFLWSAQRCVSTAFERSIRNLDNSKVFHEPFVRPFHVSEGALPGELPANSPSTYESVCAILKKDYDGIDTLFSKDMAMSLKGDYDLLMQEGLKEFRHSFLIRNPEKSLRSLYYGSFKPGATGQVYVAPKYAGFEELFELFMFIRQKLDASPVVVDADDLLDDPEGIIQSYCSAMGMKYKKNMTKWIPGPVDGFECLWSGWHDNVLYSSGISRKETRAYATERDLPEVWKQGIAKCVPYYREIREYKISTQESK